MRMYASVPVFRTRAGAIRAIAPLPRGDSAEALLVLAVIAAVACLAWLAIVVVAKILLLLVALGVHGWHVWCRHRQQRLGGTRNDYHAGE